MQGLLNRGISSRRGVMAIHRESPYGGGELETRLPVTNMVADTTLILPLFYSMTEEEQDYVIECIEHAG
jgi:dTDP-4-amino-4,6-dideoxygalactose transaminase